MFGALKVDDASGVPVWVQIRNYIIFLIRSGQLRPGDTLPTVRQLAVDLGVNHNTIHKVYQDLETDGLINAGRGRRSPIADIDRDALEMPPSPGDAMVEELARVARESGLTKRDVLSRVEAALEGLGE